MEGATVSTVATRTSRLVAVLLLGVVWLLLPSASVVWAHAAFVSSDPEPGAELTATPGDVTVRFSEPLIADLSTATVEAPTGRSFEGEVAGERTIRVELPVNAQGEYRIEWKTVSPLDGHTLRGSFRFGVGATPGTEEGGDSVAPTRSDLLVAVGRGVEFTGLLLVVGILLLRRLGRQDPPLSWVRVRPAPALAVALVAGVAVTAGEVLLASSLSWSAIAGFLTAPSGTPRLARLAAEGAGLAVAGWGGTRWAKDGGVRGLEGLVALVTAGVLVALAAAGHAAAAQPRWWGIAVDTGHLVSAGLWAGAILAMVAVRPPGGWRGEDGRALLRRFSPVAIPAFVATVAFGTLRGTQELTSLSQMLSTSYGQVLSLKVLAVLVMLPLSVRAWRRRAAATRAEASLALGAIVAAAALAAYPVPPRRAIEEAHGEEEAGPAVTALPEEGDLTLGGEAGETLIGLTLRPAAPGENEALVYLLPTGGEEAAEGLEAEIAVDGGQPTALEDCGVTCRRESVTVQGGETVEVRVAGQGMERFRLPQQLPAPAGQALLEKLTRAMNGLRTYRYDEILGPADPPITSTWELQAPDRLEGEVNNQQGTYEIIRIDDRRWTRDQGEPWRGGEPGGASVRVPTHIWDYPGRTAARILGSDTVDGNQTTILSFFVDLHDRPIWYRLWVDDQGQVPKAEMRARGHFMDHHYYDFNAPFTIQPPDG